MEELVLEAVPRQANVYSSVLRQNSSQDQKMVISVFSTSIQVFDLDINLIHCIPPVRPQASSLGASAMLE